MQYQAEFANRAPNHFAGRQLWEKAAHGRSVVHSDFKPENILPDNASRVCHEFKMLYVFTPLGLAPFHQ